ncbi:mediator of RNA polymerase II transcription subunit 15 [Drosophila tropicalis]|uniref:mediator of RNA polymerase II transcription subunit 15 n=1 Tax=Drosophila tropicalis TaxID=46794 RepID=UPI0035ABDF65
MVNMNYGHQMEPFKSTLDERDDTNGNIGKSYSYESNANPLYMPAKQSSLSYQQYPAMIMQPQQEQMSAPMSYAPSLAMQTDRQANRYVQEFPPHFLFQPPFVPMQTTALETPEPQSIAQQQQPTAEQLDLLQQLSEFFGQRQQQQHQQQQQNFIPTSFAQLASTQSPPEDQGQCPFDTEISTTISPFAKTTKKSTTTTMEPDEPVTIDVKPDKEKPISKTKSNKKLPCCSKPPKRDVISFTLNVENPNLNREQHKAREQQRSSRHAIQPDLRINAIATLLRYRNELGNAQDPLQQFLQQEQKRIEQQHAIKQRRKGKVKRRRQRRILDKNQLLQAELKIWPLKIERLSGV